MSDECQEKVDAIVALVQKSLPPQKNYYELLGVPAFTATTAAINSAYQKLVDYYHPDNMVSVVPELAACSTRELSQVDALLSEFRQQLAQAKDVLLNEAQRLQYDYDTFVK